VNPWYDGLATESGRRQALWRDFLVGDDPREVMVRRQDWVIGSDAFRQHMQRQRGRPQPRQRGRPIRHERDRGQDKGAFIPQT